MTALNPSRTLEVPHSQGCHSALEVVEVVTAILSYATSSNIHPPWCFSRLAHESDDTSTSPLLVCKRWYDIARGLRLRSCQWDDHLRIDHSAFVDVVSNHRRLRCSVGSAFDPFKGQSYWLELIAFLDGIQKPPRELCIEGVFTWSTHVFPLLRTPRLLRSITLLELSFKLYEDVDLSLLLLPNKTLGTEGLPTLRHLILRRVRIVSETFEFHRTMSLASLCLFSVEIQKQYLDTLITSLSGISLDRLCLADLCKSTEPPVTHRALEMVSLVSPEDLVRWSTQFPYLRSLEVQLAPGPDLIGAFANLQKLFPRAELFGIDYRSMFQPLGTGLIHANSTLTRIEVQKRSWYGMFPVGHLSAYLCSDQALHLESLIAPRIEFPVKFLSDQTTSTLGTPDGVWKCRHLRHLVIQLIGRKSMNYDDDFCSTLSYLVANCPKLVHLDLEREDVTLSPAGGLCLMSRLSDLKRLTLRAHYYIASKQQPKVQISSTDEKRWARWILSNPTQEDIDLDQSSLRLCRDVAKEPLSLTVAHHDVLQSKEGCCWWQMKHFRIELDSARYSYIDQAREDIQVLQCLRPDISFEVVLADMEL